MVKFRENTFSKMFLRKKIWCNYYSYSSYTRTIRSSKDPQNAGITYIVGGSPKDLMAINGSSYYYSCNNKRESLKIENNKTLFSSEKAVAHL